MTDRYKALWCTCDHCRLARARRRAIAAHAREVPAAGQLATVLVVALLIAAGTVALGLR